LAAPPLEKPAAAKAGTTGGMIAFHLISSHARIEREMKSMQAADHFLHLLMMSLFKSHSSSRARECGTAHDEMKRQRGHTESYLHCRSRVLMAATPFTAYNGCVVLRKGRL
jgi:hypothetical protein